MFTRKLFMAVVLTAGLGSIALPAFAKDIDPPTGNWGPGDFPSTGGAPGGSDYIGITGVSGQQSRGKDLVREYKVHIPKTYKQGVASPLVFCLPGLDETTTMFCVRGTNTSGGGPNGTTGGFITLSDDNNFVLVMVEGYKHSWNGGDCCGAAVSNKLDDVTLIREILKVVQQHVNIDAKRVYSAGFSNGAFMSDRLACEASDIIAAVVEGSGGIRTTPMSGCTPAHDVAVLGFHGEGGNDYFVPYQGDLNSMNQFAQVDGCSQNTTPASFPQSGGDTSCVTYTGCNAGTEVTFCSINGGGHCWYGSPSCGGGFGALGAKISLGKGTNSDTTVESADVWPFLSKFHR